MWQNSKPNYYNIRTANLALLLLLIAFAVIDLFELIYFFVSGHPFSMTASIWLRMLADIPVLLIAFLSARPAAALKFTSPKVKNVVYSLLLAFFLYLSLTVLVRLLAFALVSAGGSIPSNAVAQTMGQQPFWIAFLFYCVLAPFTEEILFRGMLQNAYERRFGWGAFVLSGIVFGLVHGGSLSMINGIAAGLMLGYIYIKTRSLWCPLMFHALFNLFAYTLVPDYYIINLPWVLGLFPEDTLSYTNPGYLVYTLGIAAIGILICYVLIRLLNRENPQNVARKSSAYVPEQGQWASSLAVVILLGLRLGLGIASSL